MQTCAVGRDIKAGIRARAVGQTDRRSGNCHILVQRKSGTAADRAAACSADGHAVAACVRTTHVVQRQAAAGLARQCADAFKPLVAEPRPAGGDTEVCRGSRAGRHTCWPTGNGHILAYHQAGSIGHRVPARSADYHTVISRIRGIDVIQNQRAAGLAR